MHSTLPTVRSYLLLEAGKHNHSSRVYVRWQMLYICWDAKGLCEPLHFSLYTGIYELPSWIKLATAHASTSLTVRSSCWQSVEILAKS